MRKGLVVWKCFLLVCFFLLSIHTSKAYSTLDSAYAALGFDPYASSNSVVVVFSDPHLCLDLTAGPAPVPITNLNPRLVNTVNAMQPPPAKILVSGDVVSTYSIAPGMIPGGDWYLTYGTNEMNLWWPALQAFTNISPENILWCPGNHDQDPREANADMLCQILGRPPHTAFDLNGIRFLLMNSGNYADPPLAEKEWLWQQVALLSPTQTVAVMVHQPPLDGVAIDRGIMLLLRDVFKDWQARWYILCGHAHSQAITVADVGRSNVAMMVSGTVNTNVFKGLTYHAGFRFLCLSNGIAGTIYYHFNNGDFEVEPQPKWQNPDKFIAAFEQTPGLLWRRLKDANPPPEVLQVKCGLDSTNWWAYTWDLQWQLNLACHSNLATHFLLLGSGIHPISTIEFSADRTNWVNTAFSEPTNSLFTFPIPPEYRTNPTVYVRFTSVISGNNFIGGWGLATTSSVPLVTYPQLMPLPDQTVLAGRALVLTNVMVNPYAPPDKFQFSLLDGPEGSTVNPTNGIFHWQPPIAGAPQTVTATMKVADYGTPVMSATQQIHITVVRPAQPELTVWPHSGYFHLHVSGDAGLTYTIWRSIDLQQWLPVTVTNPSATPFELLLPIGDQPQEFYRVSIGP